MYAIELTLKGNPSLLSVQRKEEEDANQLYQKIVASVKAGETGLVELTCDRTEKQLAVALDQICAIQLTPKTTSGGAVGARTGFFVPDGEDDDS
ncbi:MAG: hypothetical protein AAFY57_16230 [Cyanobacteria bacterium J06642_2]